jgi:putative ABC transport system ATP-binding protein
MTASPVMTFQNVSRSFGTPAGSVDVLENISFDIMPGEFLVITGPSGSGKSTLLHLAALIDQPSSGSVLLKGQDIAQVTEAELCDLRKKQIGLVFQKFCLLPHRTAKENILFRFRYLHASAATADKQTDSVMSQMSISDIANRKARLLSSGEQQRVAIARAVVQTPLLLLADEPTGNLDSKSAESVMQSFQDLNAQGLTVVMVTHNENLLSYATRHLVCEDRTVTERALL